MQYRSSSTGRQSSRRPTPRKGPAKTPPILPKTHGERREQLKAACTRLSRIVHRKVKFLASASILSLYAIAESPERNKIGPARRLVHKIIRLRNIPF